MCFFSSASSPDTPERFDISSRPVSPGMTARELFKNLTSAYIKCEVAEMRETTVFGLGHINPSAFRSVVVQLFLYISFELLRVLTRC